MSSELQRHQDLWLEDGDFILCCEGTLFRVHRAILIRNSPSLIGRIAHSNLLQDGHPGIDLESGVSSAKDLGALLYHFYNDKPLLVTSPFEHVSAILRASTQWNFPQARTLAVGHLKRKYNTRPAPYECSTWSEVSEVAELALECQTRELLPALLYGVILTSDFHVDEDEPSTVIPPCDANADTALSHLHTVCGRLIRRITGHFAPVLFTVATGNHMECTELLADHWMNLAIRPALEDSGVYKPLETLQRIKDINWESLGLCSECCQAKREEWDEEADAFWKKMQGWVNEGDDLFSQ